MMAFDDAIRATACPTCGSTSRYCRRPSGHSGPFVSFHRARVDAARAGVRALIRAGTTSASGRYHTARGRYVVHGDGRIVDARSGALIGLYDRNGARELADRRDAVDEYLGIGSVTSPARTLDGGRGPSFYGPTTAKGANDMETKTTAKRVSEPHCQSCGGVVGRDCGVWDGYTSCCNERVVVDCDPGGDCYHGEETTFVTEQSKTTEPASAPASDPITAGIGTTATLDAKTRKRRERAAIERKRAADAVARAMGLPVIDHADRIEVRAAAATAAAIPAKKTPATTGTKETTVAKKTKTTKQSKAKTTKTPATKPVETKTTSAVTAIKSAASSAAKTAAKMPAAVASIVDGFKDNDEHRYAVKVWKFKTGARSSAPAKYGLTPERAESIFKKVEAAL